MGPLKTINKKLLPTFVVVLVIIIFLLTPWGRISVKSLVLLSQFSPRQEFAIFDSLGNKFTVGQVDIDAPGGKIAADIYKPDNNKRNPAVIFLIGTRELRNSEAVQRYAKLFARAGFVVLIPEISDLVEVKMRDTTIDKIVSVFDYLAGRDFVDSKKVGFSGICAGASLSLLAASDVRINDKVKFVNAVSPYFDVWDLSREVFTRQVSVGGKVKPLIPGALMAEQLPLWYIQQVEDSNEQIILKDSISRGVIPQDEFEALSPKAKAIYNFIQSKDDNQFDKNKALLPADVKFQVEAMSERAKIGNLHAKVYILADSQDTEVSPTHSQRLADSLPKSQVKFSYVSVLDHVVPTRNLKRFGLVQDAVKIYLHIHSFLSYLDKK